jgi:sigma-B regulation protein RsbU (phosphoserine phosphatase)
VSSELTTTEMYLTLFYGILDRNARTVRYSNAGHPHAFLLPPTGKGFRLEANVPPLGLVDGIEITGSEVSIENQGDLLVVFSDGICDACDANGKAFSEARVLEVIQALHDQPTEQMVGAVFDAVAEFSTVAVDDQTLLIVRT